MKLLISSEISLSESGSVPFAGSPAISFERISLRRASPSRPNREIESRSLCAPNYIYMISFISLPNPRDLMHILTP